MVRGDPALGPGHKPRELLAALVAALTSVGARCEFVIFNEIAVDFARQQLLGLDGVLVWINPIHDGLTREVADRLLRDVAQAGVWVSAHPDVISKIGTKEVLFRTRELGWGMATDLYSSHADLLARIPSRLRRDGRLVLKQSRGNGGNGVWRVDFVREGGHGDIVVRVQHARGENVEPEEISLNAFIDRCSSYFALSGSLIAQPYVTRLGEGMIRCYLSQMQVVGFCHEWPTGLALTRSHSTMPPSVMEPPDASEYQLLRRMVEQEWVPQMLRLLELPSEHLPAIWDIDFLYGPKASNGTNTFALCEINASAVWPFPPHAIPIVAATSLAKAQEHANWE